MFMKDKIFGILCFVLAIIIAVMTVIHYYPKIMDYKKASDLYNDIRDEYTSAGDNLPAGTEDTAESEAEEKTWQETESQTEEEIYVGMETENIEIEDEPVNTKIKKKKEKKILEDLTSALKEIDPSLTAREYGCIEVDGKKLRRKNADYRGWIYIPKTNISYPVVLSKDNKDYVHTNFNKEYNYPGTIFIDCRNKNGIVDHHVVIYGHNMKDGSMFAKTKSYIEEDFFKEHPVIWFITPSQKLLYRVFSVQKTSPNDTDAFSFVGEQFKNNTEWDKIVKKLKEKSAVKTNCEVDGKDFVITLSTCTSERTTRIVTHAVLIGEYVKK